MVATVRQAVKKNRKYYELATSVRISGKIKKIFIKYIGKDPTNVNLNFLRPIVSSDFEEKDNLGKTEQLKQKIKKISDKKLFSNLSQDKKIIRKQTKNVLRDIVSNFGVLNNNHLRWFEQRLQEDIKNNDLSFDNIDKFFQNKIDTKDKISNAIFNLTSCKNKDFYNNLIESFNLEKEIKDLEDFEIEKADLVGYGGAFDASIEDEFDAFKIDKKFQTSISQGIGEKKNRLNYLKNQIKIKSIKLKDELKILNTYYKKNNIHNVKLRVSFKFDNKHHLNDIMEVYSSAKRYQALQLMKILNNNILDMKKRAKFSFINVNSKIYDYNDLDGIYARTFVFDYACDYLDNKIKKPFALKRYEKGHTKQFLLYAVKSGYLTKKIIQTREGKFKTQFIPNWVDSVNEGKTNLLRRYTGISKNRMSDLLNFKTLKFISVLNETNREMQKIKKSHSLKGMFYKYRKDLESYGVKNQKEFSFLLEIDSNENIRESCTNIINLFKVSRVF